ncbi:hypothetical protein [Brachybacterium phenoliresistens]|uniref:Uncharacterized protein n=1 Tax=Brachybacterium phenoliresistens TaxID=396014 RepID=Z9JXM6_9MICO|nr:hypothetical protein [Brachybacterium phenoliresistens]EWS82546.1 hypothetical protein BF93_05775 [Brachybacterium phenoliresistens]
MTAPAPTASRPALGLRSGLAVLAGVVVAVATGFQSDLAPLIMVCSAIYLCAAAVGRRGAAWLGFAASFVVLTPGFVLDSPWVPILALLAIQLVLVVVGVVRGAWTTGPARLQLYGAAGFGALAVLAVAVEGAGPAAGVLTVLGLLGHGAWDIGHHRADAVVTRPYALFCAVLDMVLAVLVAVGLVTGA